MALARFLSKPIFSTTNPNKLPLLRSSTSPFSTKTPTKRTKTTSPNQPPTSDFRKPSEIPYQSKVANSVHLVGSINEPVRIHNLPAGIFAVSVLVQESKKKDCPTLCIPVTFQGDLAEIAACHLKEKDLIYVTGQLSGDPVPIPVEDNSKGTVHGVQNHFQVLADSLSFVKRESEMVYDQVKVLLKDDAASDCSEHANGPNSKTESLWSDLVDNPQEWLDGRQDKLNKKASSKYPDFRQRSTWKGLWLDSAPDWVLSKLDGLVFCGVNDTTKSYGTKRNSGTKSSTGKSDGLALHGGNSLAEDSKEHANGPKSKAKSSWSDLVDNPQEWLDGRQDKLNKKVSSKHPDFKHRNTGEGLWLNRAPDWVLSKLDGLVFCCVDGTTKSYGTKRNDTTKSYMGKSDGLALHHGNSTSKSSKEDLWKDLVEYPNKWWDNRSNKLKPKSPDFKHKESGEGLWLDRSTPSWVLSKLPPAPPKQAKADTLLS